MPISITFISDTHGLHDNVVLQKTDILIHAGDCTQRGTEEEMVAFLEWFAALPHRHKIFIAGNHDFFADRNPTIFKSLIPDNIIYLENESVEIEGIKIWGSPVTPWFFDWAFQHHRGDAIRKYWDTIPKDTDIVITHGPPHGILDLTFKNINAGCEELREVIKKIKPRINVFGHIHEACGILEKDGITFINASVVNLKYEIVNAPVVMEW